MVAGAKALVRWTLNRVAEIQHLKAMGDDTRAALAETKVMRRARARYYAERVKENASPRATSEEVSKMAVITDETSQLLEDRWRVTRSLRAPERAEAGFESEAELGGDEFKELPSAEILRRLTDGKSSDEKG